MTVQRSVVQPGLRLGRVPPGFPAQAPGSTYRWTALAKPSSSLLAVTRRAQRCTSMLAFAHHDAQSRMSEHEHVVGHVADGGDLFDRNVVPGRQVLHNCALVDSRMGDVHVVGLGTGGRDVVSELLVRGGGGRRDLSGS
jgi:hypothetical protein